MKYIYIPKKLKEISLPSRSKKKKEHVYQKMKKKAIKYPEINLVNKEART